MFAHLTDAKAMCIWENRVLLSLQQLELIPKDGIIQAIMGTEPATFWSQAGSWPAEPRTVQWLRVNLGEVDMLKM